MECSIAGCERPVHVKRPNAGTGAHKGALYPLCAMHYRRVQRERYGICIVDGCTKFIQDSGLCPMHKRRLRVNGETGPAEEGKIGVAKAGEEGLPGWQRTVRSQYIKNNDHRRWRMIYKPGQPNVDVRGYIPEHRWIMSEVIGRPLLKGESVHHRNGDTLDNRAENLELWITYQPPGQRPADLLAYADEIYRRYEHLR